MGKKNAITMLFVAVVLAGLSTALNATPIIDGRFDPDEGYTLGRYVNIEKNQIRILFSVHGVG